MTEAGDEAHEMPANDHPNTTPTPTPDSLPQVSAPPAHPPYPAFLPYPPYPPAQWYPAYGPPAPLLPPPIPPREPGALERWRAPLIVALVAVFVIFGVLDVSSVFFHPAQNSGTTRPLIINAQVSGDATPAAHPDLGLAPDMLALACDKTGRVIVMNRSARPLQWTVATDSDALTFSTNTPRTGLLAPGQSVALTVMAFSQPGAYVLRFTDDHGETADMPVQITC
ncbi:MAG: hypothetical protein ACRDHP_02420 [Ktedonobacterales bacterium]